ncbi:methyltransferase domain-containing protein [Chitinophaga barathri]|uniref:Class I SAM-dependent methyltransferase n=1 Tax=Chitinophaga barathri TaxID=1647451 RepID=A0A3N4MDI2_9BACT|nr:class I SAM-dependent methyltransferase [Chitinophaga barathri]RPD38150.1 class I SAM-dependent methyltransferase [Chitinophaga barathri]
MSTVKNLLKKTALPVYLRLRGMYYQGSKVECPVCKGKFSRFLEIGYNNRPAQCPRCRSNERDRTFWLFLEKNPDFLFPGVKMLHVAPEEIYYKRFRKDPSIQYTAGDKFVTEYEDTYPADTIYLDLTDMNNIPDNTYDVILCSHVLSCIPDDAQAFREVRRVLKPGGKAILQVPVREDLPVTIEDLTLSDPQERISKFGDPNYVRFYGRDYEQRLLAQGLKTHFILLSNMISEAEIRRYGLVGTDEIHLVSK